MGDRYTMNLNCAYCGVTNKEVYYAPTCGFLSFYCPACKKPNWIAQGFHAEQITEEELERRYLIEGFSSTIEEAEMEKDAGEPEAVEKGCLCERRGDSANIHKDCPLHGIDKRRGAIQKAKKRLGIMGLLSWEDEEDEQ